MPTVTYNGPYYEARRKDTCEPWLRGQPVEVSQEWLDANRTAICTNPEVFVVKGDAKTTAGIGFTEDADGDGLPDRDWETLLG